VHSGSEISALEARPSPAASAVIILTGLALALTVTRWPLLQALVAVLTLLVVTLLFLRPEWSLALFFSSGLIKEWLLLNVPLFARYDFTVAIFLLSATSLFFFLLRRGYLFEFKTHPSMLPLFLFTALLLFSITYTPSFKYGSAKAFSFLLFNWALFIFPILLVREEATAKRIMVILGTLAISATVYTLFSLVKSLFSGSIIFSYRASFLGINPISFANWIGAISLLLITYLPSIGKRWHRRAVILALGVLLLALLAANSRGPMFSFIITLLLLLTLRARKIPGRKLMQWVALGLLFVVIALLVLPEQVTSRYTDVITQEEGTRNYTFFTVNTRLFAWNAALDMATARISSILMGVGSGGFSQVVYGQDVRLYPHNIFIEVFCELGIAGVVVLLWYLASILGDVLQTLRRKMTERMRTLFMAFCMAALFNFVNAQFSGDLNDNRRLWFFLGMVIALMQVIRSSSVEADHGSIR